MEKLNILWFGDIGRRNSFSRISESIIPYLSKYCNITILAPPQNQIIDPIYYENTKIVNIGDSTDIGLDYTTFKSMVPSAPEEQLMMKYSLLQAGFLCDKYKINVLIFLGGGFVVEWFMRLINQRRSCIPSKIVVWTPFDGIPSYDSVSNILMADCVLTTNPIMSEYLSNLNPNNIMVKNNNIDWVHHAVGDGFEYKSKNSAAKYLNKIKNSFYMCNNIIDKSDTIILNANDYIPRKRIDLTLKIFTNVYNSLKKGNKIKLWLHTNTKHPEFKNMLLEFQEIINTGCVIITHNKVSLETLNNIYNMCDIGLQTSTGEGWSLTNCEHELTGAIQIVPDFLATKFNFETSGLLIPVTNTIEKDELGNDITVGIVNIEDAEIILKNCITNIIERSNTKSNKSNYTWESAALKIFNTIENVSKSRII